MNLNELNKIEEGIFSAIKDRFQQGGYQNKVQDIFIKDFVQDALTSLNNGVKGGLINPAAKSTGSSAQPAAQPVTGTANTAQPAGQQYMGKIAPNAGPATKPAAPASPLATPTLNQPNPAAKSTGSSAQPVTGTANTAQPAGQQYMGKIAPNAGPATKPAAPASPLATPTLNQPKTTVSANTTTASKPGSITTGGVGMKIKESPYDKMNRVFESIINIDEAPEARTIADFMTDWFTQYMQGVNWQSSQAIVKQKLNKLQDEYPKNVDANLKDLARIGLALSKAGSPAGAPQEFTQAKKDQASSVEDLKSALDGLSKSDPKAFNELIKNLKPVQTGFFSEDTK